MSHGCNYLGRFSVHCVEESSCPLLLRHLGILMCCFFHFFCELYVVEVSEEVFVVVVVVEVPAEDTERHIETSRNHNIN